MLFHPFCNQRDVLRRKSFLWLQFANQNHKATHDKKFIVWAIYHKIHAKPWLNKMVLRTYATATNEFGNEAKSLIVVGAPHAQLKSTSKSLLLPPTTSFKRELSQNWRKNIHKMLKHNVHGAVYLDLSAFSLLVFFLQDCKLKTSFLVLGAVKWNHSRWPSQRKSSLPFTKTYGVVYMAMN